MMTVIRDSVLNHNEEPVDGIVFGVGALPLLPLPLPRPRPRPLRVPSGDADAFGDGVSSMTSVGAAVGAEDVARATGVGA